MSALAKYLKFKGYIVTGSDKSTSTVTRELKKYGITVFSGHKKENIIGADVVIYSSAIPEDNEELYFARKNKSACISRAELLEMISSKYCQKIAVSGSHGKTTVTSLLAHILNVSDTSFTAHIGGFDNVLGNLVVKGDGVFLSEVCEFKRNIEKFSPTTAVCLNIDNDHLNCYRDVNELAQTFYTFLDKAETRIINADDGKLKYYDKSSVTFGEKSGDYTFKNYLVEGDKACFDVLLRNKKLFDVKTNYIGKYYAMNVTAAAATAFSLGITVGDIEKGINDFKGVKRRNEIIGQLNGWNVIGDYAHHPSEIKNFMSAFKDKKVLCVFQPHTYSRTRILFDDFVAVLSDIPNLFLYKTYSARENYDYYGSAERLSNALYDAKYYDNFRLLYKNISEFTLNSNSNGLILVVGAGDLYDKFCNELHKEKTRETSRVLQQNS